MVLVRIILQSLMEKRTEMMQTLLSLISTAGKETGCLSYDAFCDLESDNTFNLIEEWESRADLDRHIGSERFSVLLGTKSLLLKPLEMSIHTVSQSEGSEIIKAVRGMGTSIKISTAR